MEPLPVLDEVGPPPDSSPLWRIALWIVAAILVALVVWTLVPDIVGPELDPAGTGTAGIASATAPLAPTSPLRATPVAAAPTFSFVEPTATPTAYPGGQIHTLVPGPAGAGWVAADESRGNHFGDSFLYSGVFEGVIYHGAFQFDLSVVPSGAPLHYASLELVGLDGSRLGESGAWEVRLLSRKAGDNWASQAYQDIHNAPVEWTLVPALAHTQLEAGVTYSFGFPAELLAALEQRLQAGHATLSFRIDGPYAGGDNVFAWDTGYGPASEGRPPRLLVSVGEPSGTPGPTGSPAVVVVTSTPTPANVVTAAAYARTATAIVGTAGAPTPTSPFEWTATPERVLTNTPTPANRATADWLEVVATAVALTTGTVTPTPEYIRTATVTPIAIPVEDLTATPTPTPLEPPPALPSALANRILYQSDRAGGIGPWVMDASGGNVALLTADWPYLAARIREALSPDGSLQVYASQVEGQSALLIRPLGGDRGDPVVLLAAGQASSPAWSPTGTQVAFVSTATGRAQVWVVGSDGNNLRQLTDEAWGTATSPSFGPDGTHLVYAAADGAGRRQIWSIALDGTDRLNLSDNSHDEWSPVWVK